MHGPAGRVFRHLKHVILPLRQGLSFAAVDCHDSEQALAVGRRCLEALALLVACDDTAEESSVRGSTAACLFVGRGSTAFALVATPLAAFRTKVATSREFARKEPRYVATADMIAAVLTVLEQKGGAPARRAIAAAFPGGLAG